MGRKSTEMRIEGEAPLFSERIKRAQKAFRSKDWRNFKEIFEEDKKDLLEDFDLFRNTAINVATRSDSPKLLKELLEMLSEEERWVALTKKNCQGDTLLHEIALGCKEVEMADLVLEFEKKAAQPLLPAEQEEEKRRPLLERRNSKSETPLFRAAKFGNLKMVKHLAKHAASQPQGDMKIHLHDHSRTILHACVGGQFFGKYLSLARVSPILFLVPTLLLYMILSNLSPPFLSLARVDIDIFIESCAIQTKLVQPNPIGRVSLLTSQLHNKQRGNDI